MIFHLARLKQAAEMLGPITSVGSASVVAGLLAADLNDVALAFNVTPQQARDGLVALRKEWS